MKKLVVLLLAILVAACGSSSSDTVEGDGGGSSAAVTATSAPRSDAPTTTAPSQVDAPTPTVAELEPTATTTNATPQSTATVPPSPATAAQDLILVDSGFGQQAGAIDLGWAFVVENPNAELAIARSEYQVAVTDAAGTVLETDSGFLELLMPGERLGVGGTIYLPEGTTAAAIDVTLNAGDAESVDVNTPFATSQVVWHGDEYTPRVSGMVSNPFDRDLEDLQISVVAYDAAGAIIGGGYTYLNFILANGQAPIELTLSSSADPASVELFATITSLTSLAASVDQDRPEQPLVLEGSGFSFGDFRTFAWGFVVQNPNAGDAVDLSMYHVAALDDAGNVVGFESGYIALLTPGERLGVGGTLYVAEGKTATRIDVQVLAGAASPMEPTQLFATENVTFIPDDFSPKVTGIVKNLTNTVLEDLRVNAIAYDEAGQIIGGGYTYLDFVPAQGQAAADVGLEVNGTPARVELFPGVSTLTDLDP